MSVEIRVYVYPDGKPKSTVLWVSRHSPLPAQLESLSKRLGCIRVIQISKLFASAEEIIEYADRFRVNYIVAVLPLSMIMRLVELARSRGITVLWSEMEVVADKLLSPPTIDPDREVILTAKESDGSITYRVYRFKNFKKIRAIKMELEPI